MNELYLRIDGIQGESKDNLHKNWIDITNYSWGVDRAAIGSNAAVTCRNLIVHAQLDKATAALFSHALSGKMLSKAEIAICRAGGEFKEFCRITLENVCIMSVDMSATGLTPGVSYELQADKVSFQYWEQTARGGRGPETQASWDIKAHRA